AVLAQAGARLARRPTRSEDRIAGMGASHLRNGAGLYDREPRRSGPRSDFHRKRLRRGLSAGNGHRTNQASGGTKGSRRHPAARGNLARLGPVKLREESVPAELPRRSGFVALLGAPNAGKSTLVNRLVGAKVSIVTHKVQTTRALVRGIVMHRQT